MKNIQIWLFCSIMLLQLGAYTQNEYFANEPRWGINWVCQFAPFEPEWGSKTTHFVNGDTLLNDEVFVKIFEEGFSYSGTGTNSYSEAPYFNPLPLVFLRSEGMKMFKWNEELSMKELLYDFDVNVGDTFNVLGQNSLTVVAINTINLGGFERRIITTNVAPESEESYEFEYIEGVGHWRGLWYPNGVQLDCNSFLTCFSLNGESYVVDTNEYPWLTPSTNECEFIASINEYSEVTPRVYPNPCKQELNIRSEIPIRSIEISDPTGRIVHREKPNALYLKVPSGTFANGFYNARFILEDGYSTNVQFQKH